MGIHSPRACSSIFAVRIARMHMRTHPAERPVALVGSRLSGGVPSRRRKV